MFIPNVTQTAGLAASTGLTLSPTSVTTIPVQSTSPSPLPNITNAGWCGTPVPRWPPVGEPPSMPWFLENDHIYDYWNETSLDRCVREATKLAGRARFEEITSDGAWKDWAKKHQDPLREFADSNKDGNTLNGLAKHVISSAVEHNPSLDFQTRNKETCLELVELYGGDRLLDEIISAWAWREGHIKGPTFVNPYTGLPVEKGHVADDVAPNHANRTKPVWTPGNSTRTADGVVVEFDENNVPSAITDPEKKTSILLKWGILRNLTLGNLTLSKWPIVTAQVPHGEPARKREDKPVRSIPHPDTQYPGPPYPPPPGKFLPGNSTLLGRSTRPFNSTLQRHYCWVPVQMPTSNASYFGPGNGSSNHTRFFNHSTETATTVWVPLPVHTSPDNSTHSLTPRDIVNIGVGNPFSDLDGVFNDIVNIFSGKGGKLTTRGTSPHCPNPRDRVGINRLIGHEDIGAVLKEHFNKNPKGTLEVDTSSFPPGMFRGASAGHGRH